MKAFKLILATALIAFTSSQLNAQSDTIYLNFLEKETVRDSAEYYRFIFPKGEVFEVKDYFLNGVLQMTGTFSSLKPQVKMGNFRYYHRNNALSFEGIYVNNMQEGIWKEYDTSSTVREIMNYRKDVLHGEFTTYYASGKLKRKENHHEGKFINGKCFDERGEEITFYAYEEPAAFIGGKSALMKFLSDNTFYPGKAYKKRIQGKVMIRFVVSPDGSISDVRILKGVHKSLDAEAIRVVKSMPKWISGKQDGIPVKSYFDLPINFLLD